MKKNDFLAVLAITIVTSLFIYGCGGGNSQASSTDTAKSANTSAPANSAAEDAKGTGKFTDVKLTHPLDQSMVKQGSAVYDVKCNACHKLTSDKLVGPGWKGVTDRRKPEWIMNFVTNTDAMLEKDTAAKSMVETCMVRMPNQHLSDDDARHVLEFMRNNDGKN
ncbi:MAG: cytochrome c [Bacteroidetes bacterium]|jgi:mono/diheme cytochrome c family protein|nr:cytochrome c [Bacteroidota bacterium]